MRPCEENESKNNKNTGSDTASGWNRREENRRNKPSEEERERNFGMIYKSRARTVSCTGTGGKGPCIFE